MSYFFGLYFGNTNLCIAVHKEGKTDVIANAAGDRVTPSFVSFANGEKLVGLSAKQGMVRNASNTLNLIKCVLGGDTEAAKECTCKIIEEGGLKYSVEKDGKMTCYEAINALSDLFTNMAVIAKSNSHETDVPVVIAVPQNFTQKQREKIKMAAMKSGFRLLRLISEPSAATLAYDIGQDTLDSACNVLIYRMGGTSMEVTVIKVMNGIYHILSSVDKRDISGNVFTQRLVEFCANEFQRQYKADIRESKRSVMKVQAACEICKHTLSSIGTAQCFAESVYDGIDMSINVSRARFESLISNDLQSCLEPVQEALRKANLSADDIEKLIFVGGSCKIPKLQQALSDMFPGTTTMTSISPDEVIATGAAKQAAFVPQEDDDIITEKDCLINILSHDINARICSKEPSAVTLFCKGSPIPACYSQTFVFESSISHVDLIEQLEESTEKHLARLPMSDFKNFTITAHLSKEGILRLSCSDNVSQVKRVVTIMPTSD